MTMMIVSSMLYTIAPKFYVSNPVLDMELNPDSAFDFDFVGSGVDFDHIEEGNSDWDAGVRSATCSSILLPDH